MDDNIRYSNSIRNNQELIITYITDKTIDDIKYIKNDIIEVHASGTTTYISINNGEEEYCHSWDVTTSDNQCTKIISSNITMDNIKIIRGKNLHTTTYNFENTSTRNEELGIYTITLSNDKVAIDVDVPLIYDFIVEKNDYGVIAKAKNRNTEEYDYIHYLLDDIYYVVDNLNHTESAVINGENIRYDFESENPAKAMYIQCHNPVRVTNYDTDDQYIIKYDDYGIMKSMINISEPDKELCDYQIKSIDMIKVDMITSIHPDIYDSFDKHNLRSDFIETNEKVLDRYTKMKDLGSSIYERMIIVVDQ